MASTTFTDNITPIAASWLNDVNSATYTILGNGTSYTGVLTLAGTTDSTSTTTGMIINAGGAGIAKALWVGGLANVAGVATLANATDASSSTVGGTVVSGGLAVAKKIWTAGPVNVSGANATSVTSNGDGSYGSSTADGAAIQGKGSSYDFAVSNWNGAYIFNVATGTQVLNLYGDIIGQTTQSVFNTVSNTVNAFGAATTATLGATTGTMTLRNATIAVTNALTVGGTLGQGTTAPNPTGVAILTGGQTKGVLLARNASGSPGSGEVLGSFGWKGIMDGANTIAAGEAYIDAVTTEAHTGSTAATSMRFYTKASGTGPGSTPTLRMTIDGTGAVTIGGSLGVTGITYLGKDEDNKTEATAQLIVQGAGYGLYQWLDATAAYIGQNSGSRELRMYAGATPTTGVKLTSGATSWVSTSDETLKDIIEPITGAGAKVASMRHVIGKYKTDSEGVRRSFLIAQDAKKVIPEAVHIGSDGALNLSYTDIIPLHGAAIAEHESRLTALQAEFQAYKAAHP